MDVTVLTSGHDVADARLHRHVAALRRAGLSVEVRGLGDAAGGPEGAEVHARTRPGLAGRAALDLLLPLTARGAVLLTLDPDLALAAVPLARLRRRGIVVDVHEDYLALLDDRSWASGPVGTVARAVARLATRVVGRADLTAVADEHVPPQRARRRMVVRNRPDLSMTSPAGEPDAVPRAIYIGDVRASRGLWTMVDAVAATPDWRLDIVGPIAVADRERAAAVLDAAGAGDRVRFHGRLAPADAWTFARGAWVGLALLQDTPAFREALPTKVGEYLACGLPVVVTDLPRMRAVVESTGAGAVLAGPDPTGGLRELLSGWSADPTGLEPLRRSARAAADHSGASEYDTLADAVAAMVQARRGGRTA